MKEVIQRFRKFFIGLSREFGQNYMTGGNDSGGGQTPHMEIMNIEYYWKLRKTNVSRLFKINQMFVTSLRISTLRRLTFIFSGTVWRRISPVFFTFV